MEDLHCFSQHQSQRVTFFSVTKKTPGKLNHLCFVIPLGLGFINVQIRPKIFKNTSENAQPYGGFFDRVVVFFLN